MRRGGVFTPPRPCTHVHSDRGAPACRVFFPTVPPAVRGRCASLNHASSSRKSGECSLRSWATMAPLDLKLRGTNTYVGGGGVVVVGVAGGGVGRLQGS
jgi:hypothetical protein